MSRLPATMQPEVPFGFCPGCSHRQLTEALGKGMVLAGRSPTEVALVTDIGCVGLIDKHFATHTFHGLHGRSITYATGLALARPELAVLVAIGDGGCGIGANHLIHAARRDVDLTVLVFNNFNYGMTGGEHSPTTPLGGFTSSTPAGNVEPPFDLCRLVEASGASFVARTSAFHGDLVELVARGIAHRGFALIDAWELCTAYYMHNNDFKKKDLLAYAEQAGMDFGVLHEDPRRVSEAAAPPPPAPVVLSPVHPVTLAQRVAVVLAGSAGQKVKTAANLLGRTAARSRAHVTVKDDYPITVKTGHSVAEVVLSPSPILHTAIDAPDVLIALTEDGVRRVHATFAHLAPGARVYADARLELPESAATGHRLDLAAASKRVGRQGVALWATAHVALSEGLVTPEALVATAEATTPARFHDATLAVLEDARSAHQAQS